MRPPHTQTHTLTYDISEVIETEVLPAEIGTVNGRELSSILSHDVSHGLNQQLQARQVPTAGRYVKRSDLIRSHG